MLYIIIIIIIIIIILPTSSVKHTQQQVQNYDSGRTTRQRAALTIALKYELKRKL